METIFELKDCHLDGHWHGQEGLLFSDFTREHVEEQGSVMGQGT